MSGTSMDGIDAILASVSENGCELKKHSTTQYPHDLAASVRSIAQGENDDLHTVAVANRAIGKAFAAAAEQLLEKAGVDRSDVVAIGSHGQTVRHHPPSVSSESYTLQIGDPATIAEMTGITTVAEFRTQDLAAGGEGAPLAPAFHAVQFGEAGKHRAIVNVGGISNATLLAGKEVIGGFDCGPGNTLLDAWINEVRSEPYDAHGAWSAEHQVIEPLLLGLTEDPYFDKRGPRSTGPEHFNLGWLKRYLTGGENPGDVQATLAELTAFAIAQSLEELWGDLEGVYVCGGGARNTDLMRRLGRRLAPHDIALGTTDDLGLDAEWVEASAWAWLAYARLHGIPANAPLVTGAAGPRVLGTITAANHSEKQC